MNIVISSHSHWFVTLPNWSLYTQRCWRESFSLRFDMLTLCFVINHHLYIEFHFIFMTWSNVAVILLFMSCYSQSSTVGQQLFGMITITGPVLLSLGLFYTVAECEPDFPIHYIYWVPYPKTSVTPYGCIFGFIMFSCKIVHGNTTGGSFLEKCAFMGQLCIWIGKK